MSNTRKRKHGGLTQDGETRIKVERSLSSSDSDEELSSPSYASFLHGDRKPVYSDVVWKQMEKMGYKAGESLGKTGLGNKHFSVTKNQGNDSEDEVLNNASQPESVYSDFAQRQMESMGFQQGGGLGRFGQGRADIIEASQQRGRRGLGFRVEGFDDKDFTWEEEEEVVIVEPKVCIPSCPRPPPTKEEMEDWIRIGKKKLTIDDETQFCSEEVLAEVLKSKTVFDALSGDEFLKARTRANPYEFIRGAIFQNRAAMKMANMDSAFDFMFTSPKDDKGRDLIGPNDLLYFADLCAGPGGFSEYVLWRKGWQAKGFGFTLRGDNDFKLEEFLAGTPETFEPHYGVHDDGDIYNEDNLVEFRRHVLELTDDKGVHFVMADGGFSVAGQENIQEILSKQLYLCQFLCAVSILRTGGHFVCKLFDLFTSFSVGLVYLMYRIFDEVYIFKPVTSRPANSERYVVCKGLRPNIQDVLEHMFNTNVRINKMKNQDIDDVMEIVPLHILLEDEEFSSYMVDSNDRIGKVQANSLKKLRAYVQDTTLMGHYDQGEVKKRCLETWKIPEQARAAPKNPDPDVKFDELWKGIDDDHCFDSEPTTLTSKNMQNLKCLYNYKCFVSGGERWFFMGLGRSNIYKWDGKPNYRSATTWHKLENFHLELPRDTLIEVEIVQELRGEGKGQRRSAAVHIVDAVILGGKDVRNLHYSERMAKAGLLVKAVNKPTCQGMVPLRLKHIFRVDSSSLKEIFTSRIDMKVVKGKSREPRECFMLEDGRHLLPKGIFFIKRIQAGLSTGGEDLRRRLEQVENRKSYKEITCDVAKCGSRKESRNNSNVPARITCIPHSITEERHLISDFYVKPIETIQSCQEVTSGCQRFPRMYTYYPHTTFNRTIDVGVCAGSCGNQLSCRPVWTNQKAIATPNGERLIPVIKSCSCVKPSCYRVAKYEAFAELYTDDQGNNATRTKLVDMGHCESERMCPFSKRGLPTSCGFQLKYISILSAAGSYTTVAPVKRCTCGD